MARLRIGCTSYTYRDWLGSFYPAGAPAEELLRRYARVFDLVEIDATFYRMPSTAVSARWAADTPDGFAITVKLPRRITHEQKLVGVEDMLHAFLERVEPVRRAGKLAALLAQFPPGFARDKGQAALEPFLELVPGGVRLAVEFRNKSWFQPEVYDVLRAHGACLVWQLTPEEQSPPVLTSDWLYVRLIGPDRVFEKFDRVQRDLRPRMRALRERLEDEGKAAKEALLLCSNHFMGHGPGTAAILHGELGLPPPDLGAAKRPVGAQRGLADFA